MKFSTAALTFSLLAIVNSSVITYDTEFGDNYEHKHDKYDCEIDTFNWKFALVVKEWKYHKDEKFCKDTDLDLVYEGEDGQLYHGCDGTYPYSKCKHCTNVLLVVTTINGKMTNGTINAKIRSVTINGMTNARTSVMTNTKTITAKIRNAMINGMISAMTNARMTISATTNVRTKM